MSDYVDGSKKVGCFTGCLVIASILGILAIVFIFI
jgi:hypothetical protein